uniref:Si:ch211-215a10.4 n=1 Tax=Oryzias latipes TaxID=8090 RepID=A0A3P9HN49_ORYLA
MAASRGGVAFWVGCVCSNGARKPVQNWSRSQVVDWRWLGPTRPLSSAVWALASPNSLRYQNVKQPVLSHPLHPAIRPQKPGCAEEDWEESRSVCVLVPPRESERLRSLLAHLPELSHTNAAEQHFLKTCRSSAFSFPLTTVNGSREDDINVLSLQRDTDLQGEPDCFRSLFEAERCPAPFMYGSRFYCFHCPISHLLPDGKIRSFQNGGLSRRQEVSLMPAVTLCSHASQTDGQQREQEEEERLALMLEKLRIELPSFFLTNHDYSIYSNDVEFINGLLNIKTRGRQVYQLTLSLWRFLVLCYYAEARLDVLKLTKHPEDGTIKARWRIRGLPFHCVLLRFYRKDKTHLYRSYDAFSTFYVGQDGLIHCHKVEKVMPAQPPVLPRVRALLTGALVALGVQEHRPALNLLPPLLSSLRQNRD